MGRGSIKNPGRRVEGEAVETAKSRGGLRSTAWEKGMFVPWRKVSFVGGFGRKRQVDRSPPRKAGQEGG